MRKKNQLKAVIDKTFTMEEIKEAHTLTEKGVKIGNYVIKIG